MDQLVSHLQDLPAAPVVAFTSCTAYLPICSVSGLKKYLILPNHKYCYGMLCYVLTGVRYLVVKYLCFVCHRLQPSLRFIHWNKEGWKTGLCSVPPVGHPYSLLTLSNNSCIW